MELSLRSSTVTHRIVILKGFRGVERPELGFDVHAVAKSLVL